MTRRENGRWHLQAMVSASPGLHVSAHSPALGGLQGRHLVTSDSPTQTRPSLNMYKQTSTHTTSPLFGAGRNTQGLPQAGMQGWGLGGGLASRAWPRAGLSCLPNILGPLYLLGQPRTHAGY